MNADLLMHRTQSSISWDQKLSVWSTACVRQAINRAATDDRYLLARGGEDVGAAGRVKLEARPLLARQFAGLDFALHAVQRDHVDRLFLLPQIRTPRACWIQQSQAQLVVVAWIGHLVVAEVVDLVVLQCGVAVLPGLDAPALLDQVASLLGRLQPGLRWPPDEHKR